MAAAFGQLALRGLGTLAALALAAGCGGEPDRGLAGVVPEEALVWIEAEIDPSGEREAAVRSLIAKFPGSGPPQDRIPRLLEREVHMRYGELDYSEDVESWLGDRAGLFVSSASPASTEAALVLSAADRDKAHAVLDAQLDGEREYRGVEVRVGEEDLEATLVHDFVVVGTRGAVEDAIDASRDDSLEGSDRYRDAIGGLPGERLATLYVDGGRLLDPAVDASREAALFRQSFGRPFAITLEAERDALTVEYLTPPSPEQAGAEAAPRLLSRLSGDAWFASARLNYGEQLARELEAAAGPGLAERLRRQTGLELERDVSAWVGDVAAFVRGTAPEDLGAAALIHVTDQRLARRALERIRRALEREREVRVERLRLGGRSDGFSVSFRGLPEPVQVVRRGDRVVVGYGAAATDDAFDPVTRLHHNPLFSQAVESLGRGYSAAVWVEVEPILRLLDASGGREAAQWQAAKPYLEPVMDVVAGSRRERDRTRWRVRVRLR